MTHRHWSFSRRVLAVSLAAFLTVPLLSMSAWIPKSDLPNPRSLHGLGVVSGVLYALGGESECFGGGCSSERVARYDAESDTWTDVATLTPRKNHATVVAGGLIYLIGGDDNNTVFSSVDTYDPVTHTVSGVTPMTHAGSLVTAAELNGQLYVLGGSAGRGLIAEAYDLGMGSWQSLPNLPRLTYAATAAAYQGKVWLIGGSNPSTGEVYAQVEAYDPSSESWSSMPSLPGPRTAGAAVVVDDTLYLVGGFTPGIGSLASVLKYDTVTGSWVEGPELNVPRASFAVALLSGTLYAVGGKAYTAEGGGGGNLASVESLALGGNLAPTANAGLDQTLHAGHTVSLDGGGSFDDNTAVGALVYSWSLESRPAGSTAVVTGANTATPSFIPDKTGTYVVQLVVTDEGELSSTPDSVVISSTNQAPTANAGSNQIVAVGHPAALSGSGFDPDGDSMTFAWTLTSAPAGSAAALTGANSATSELVPDMVGTYAAQLVVSDGFTTGIADEVEITAVSLSDFSQVKIQDAAQAIAGLPLSSVTTGGNQQALTNLLGQAVQFIQAGNAAQARHKLESAIKRTDGCVLRGGPDGPGPTLDWITVCGAQLPVYQSLIQALAAITP